MSTFVVALIATFRRAPELARLLASLETSVAAVGAVVVVDNASDSATAAVCEESRLDVRYFAQAINLGCGGGLRQAEEYALGQFASQLTHVWILDDDVVVSGESLSQLLESMEKSNAEAAAPMVLDQNGRIGWFSGLIDSRKFDVIRRRPVPDDYLSECGTEPVEFSWTTGICLLITRRLLETVGFHRTDFWIRGEDLEFSLRITAQSCGIFVPEARVEHLVPTSQDSATSRRNEYLKCCAHTQNVTYIGLCLPHGRPIRRKIPGHYYRLLCGANWRWSAWCDAVRAFWWGALRGKPAGVVRWM